MVSHQRSHNRKSPEGNHGGVRNNPIIYRKIIFIVDHFRQYTFMALGNMELHSVKLFSFCSSFRPSDSIKEKASVWC